MSGVWHLEHITAMRGQAWKPGTAEHKDVQREACTVRVSPASPDLTCLTQPSQRENGQFKRPAVSFPLLLAHIIPVSNGRYIIDDGLWLNPPKHPM